MDDPGTLDPRVRQLWRLQGLLRVGMFWLPASVALFSVLSLLASASVGAVLAGALLAVQVLLALAWPALSYERFRYALREHDLLITRGVLFRIWTSVPFARIQHVDTRQGPLERALGLARVLVYTASGVGADGSIPGLDETSASELRDRLSRLGGDDGV